MMPMVQDIENMIFDKFWIFRLDSAYFSENQST